MLKHAGICSVLFDSINSFWSPGFGTFERYVIFRLINWKYYVHMENIIFYLVQILAQVQLDLMVLYLPPSYPSILIFLLRHGSICLAWTLVISQPYTLQAFRYSTYFLLPFWFVSMTTASYLIFVSPASFMCLEKFIHAWHMWRSCWFSFSY